MHDDEDGDKIEFITNRIERGLPVKPEHFPPDLDICFSTLVEIYFDLWSENKLSYAEIQSFCSMTGIRLNPWEIRCLRIIDHENRKIKNQADSARYMAAQKAASAQRTQQASLRSR